MTAEQVAAEALREWQRNTPAVMRSSPTTVWIDRAEQPASVVVAALREHGYLTEPSAEDGPSAELRHHIAYRPMDRDEDVCLECSSFEDGLYVPWPCSLVRMAQAGTSPDTDDLRDRLAEALKAADAHVLATEGGSVDGAYVDRLLPVVLAFAAEQSASLLAENAQLKADLDEAAAVMHQECIDGVPEVDRLTAERDEARAALARVKALHHKQVWYYTGWLGNYSPEPRTPRDAPAFRGCSCGNEDCATLAALSPAPQQDGSATA